MLEHNRNIRYAIEKYFIIVNKFLKKRINLNQVLKFFFVFNQIKYNGFYYICITQTDFVHDNIQNYILDDNA